MILLRQEMETLREKVSMMGVEAKEQTQHIRQVERQRDELWSRGESLSREKEDLRAEVTQDWDWGRVVSSHSIGVICVCS